MSAQIRFRHTHGDVGPMACDTSTSVAALKQRLLDEWPAGARREGWEAAARLPCVAAANGACWRCRAVPSAAALLRARVLTACRRAVPPQRAS